MQVFLLGHAISSIMSGQGCAVGQVQQAGALRQEAEQLRATVSEQGAQLAAEAASTRGLNTRLSHLMSALQARTALAAVTHACGSWRHVVLQALAAATVVGFTYQCNFMPSS